MERIPQGKYTPEFRVEAVKMVEWGQSESVESKRFKRLPVVHSTAD